MLKYHFKPFTCHGEDLAVWWRAQKCVSDIWGPGGESSHQGFKNGGDFTGEGLATQMWETCHWFFSSHIHSWLATLSMTDNKTAGLPGGRSWLRQHIWSLNPQVINPSYSLCSQLSYASWTMALSFFFFSSILLELSTWIHIEENTGCVWLQREFFMTGLDSFLQTRIYQKRNEA